MSGFRFWYFGELFLLLQFCGISHVSYLWVILFYIIDAGEYIHWRRDVGLPSLRSENKSGKKTKPSQTVNGFSNSIDTMTDEELVSFAEKTFGGFWKNKKKRPIGFNSGR